MVANVMGSQLARWAMLVELDNGPQIAGMTPAARLCLIHMAMAASDIDNGELPAGHYFGGWDHLARALGHPSAETNTAGHSAVKRAMRELVQAGLVELVGRTKWKRVYRLNVLPGAVDKYPAEWAVDKHKSVDNLAADETPAAHT